MTNPTHAQATDRGRYYQHPVTGERWPSITNVLDTVVNKPALVPWAAKVTAEAALRMLPALVKTSRDHAARDLTLKEIKAQVRYVKDTAADLGSRIHAQAEARVLGKPVAEDEECAPYVEQLLEFFDRWGVDFDKDIEAAEATVINRAHGYAGTGDLWVWLHVGPDLAWTPRKRHLWVLDYKTSATRPVDSTYPENGLQVAAVAGGERLLLDDGTELDPPGPIVGTAVLNLRADAHALIPVPKDRDAAFAAFCALVTGTRYLHGIDKKPKALACPRPIATTTKKGAA